MTEDQPQDSALSLVAIGVLAYSLADVAHHVLGHGLACLALGGSVRSLTSVRVDCTLTGPAIDIAGPLANLAIGLAGLVVLGSQRSAAVGTRVFLALLAAFNLLWFAAQLGFDAATMTDDWAVPLRSWAPATNVRWILAALAALLYLATIWLMATRLTGFDASRMRRIVRSAYAAGGATACFVAAFDPHPLSAIFNHAAPQSFVAAIGLLLVPRFVRPASMWGIARGVPLSIAWILAALVALMASIVYLGPGFKVFDW